MESLDQTGRLLYDSYINAQDAWISYIRPKAITKFDSYLSSAGRKYYKYEYYADTTNGYMKDKTVQNTSKNPDMLAKYKKLCILFHPDKFIHPSSTELFYLLKKWSDTNNSQMLDILDRIAHLILEIQPCDEISFKNMLANLNHPHILDTVKINCQNIDDSRTIFDLITTEPNKLNFINCDNDETIQESMKAENFINTIAYKFFMNADSIRTELDSAFLTEAEIIDYIKQRGQYDDDFLAFYFERYRDNENIIRAVVEMQLQKRDELQKENERLKARIKQLSEQS